MVRGRGKTKMELIPNVKSRLATFKARKMGMVKKASELSTLCGVKVCLVINGPGKDGNPGGKPEIWPPDNDEVRRIVSMYNEKAGDRNLEPKYGVGNEGFKGFQGFQDFRGLSLDEVKLMIGKLEEKIEQVKVRSGLKEVESILFDGIDEQIVQDCCNDGEIDEQLLMNQFDCVSPVLDPGKDGMFSTAISDEYPVQDSGAYGMFSPTTSGEFPVQDSSAYGMFSPTTSDELPVQDSGADEMFSATTIVSPVQDFGAYGMFAPTTTDEFPVQYSGADECQMGISRVDNFFDFSQFESSTDEYWDNLWEF